MILIDCTHCNNRAISCSESNDVNVGVEQVSIALKDASNSPSPPNMPQPIHRDVHLHSHISVMTSR